MADIQIPKLGMTMTEVTLVEWLVADGTEVTEGQNLYTLESDKAVQEISSPASGRLSILAQPGGTYAVGELIGRIE
jgi:pyruvate/2-oxoglutarate dehydrogenase complex dihydrolipoamide acyltransferase (E2) component